MTDPDPVLFIESEPYPKVSFMFEAIELYFKFSYHTHDIQGRRQGVAKGLSGPPPLRVIWGGGVAHPPRFFKFFSPLNHGFLS